MTTAKATIFMACERLASDGGSSNLRAMPGRSRQGRAPGTPRHRQNRGVAKPANFQIINNVESLARAIALPCTFPPGLSMIDTATKALLRTVLDEVCEGVPRCEIGARTRVASKLLETASRGDISADRLKQAGRDALSEVSRM
jgi:hypothetical protein